MSQDNYCKELAMFGSAKSSYWNSVDNISIYKHMEIQLPCDTFHMTLNVGFGYAYKLCIIDKI